MPPHRNLSARVSPASALPAAILEKYAAHGVAGENFREQARRGLSRETPISPHPATPSARGKAAGYSTTPIAWFRFSLNDPLDRRETS